MPTELLAPLSPPHHAERRDAWEESNVEATLVDPISSLPPALWAEVEAFHQRFDAEVVLEPEDDGTWTDAPRALELSSVRSWEPPPPRAVERAVRPEANRPLGFYGFEALFDARPRAFEALAPIPRVHPTLRGIDAEVTVVCRISPKRRLRGIFAIIAAFLRSLRG